VYRKREQSIQYLLWNSGSVVHFQRKINSLDNVKDASLVRKTASQQQRGSWRNVTQGMSCFQYFFTFLRAPQLFAEITVGSVPI
jgi:hypothetical protein